MVLELRNDCGFHEAIYITWDFPVAVWVRYTHFIVLYFFCATALAQLRIGMVIMRALKPSAAMKEVS